VWITRLHAEALRVYDELVIHFERGVNLISGPNGAGKSTVLEGIEYLSSGRSLRAKRDRELIKWNCQQCTLHCDFTDRAGSAERIDALVDANQGRSVKVNDKVQTHLRDWIGRLKTVSFSREDLELVSGDPSVRRRFLNLEISKLRPQYLQFFSQYRRSLEQRNALLKELRRGHVSSGVLEQWDRSLVEYGSRVVAERIEFLRSLSRSATLVQQRLTDGSERLHVEYECSFDLTDLQMNERNDLEVEQVKERFRHSLSEKRREELDRGVTLIGPHRDDMCLLLGLTASKSDEINWVDMRKFSSQGQGRTAALAVKLGLARMTLEAKGDPPILLLDDVFSELDAVRRKAIVQQFHSFDQLLITTTDPGLIEPPSSLPFCHFAVSNGAVRRIT